MLKLFPLPLFTLTPLPLTPSSLTSRAVLLGLGSRSLLGLVSLIALPSRENGGCEETESLRVTGFKQTVHRYSEWKYIHWWCSVDLV